MSFGSACHRAQRGPTTATSYHNTNPNLRLLRFQAARRLTDYYSDISAMVSWRSKFDPNFNPGAFEGQLCPYAPVERNPTEPGGRIYLSPQSMQHCQRQNFAFFQRERSFDVSRRSQLGELPGADRFHHRLSGPASLCGTNVNGNH